MTFLEAFKKVYIEEIFTISGRASRKEYWGCEVIAIPLYFIVAFGSYMFFSFQTAEAIDAILRVWSFIAVITAGIRRMHDIGKSGWYNLIPIYNLYLSITPSEQSDNEWGSPRPHTIVNQSASDDE